jgi:hypothetical protein
MAAPFEPAMCAPASEVVTAMSKPTTTKVPVKPFSVFLPLHAAQDQRKASASPATASAVRQSIFSSTPKATLSTTPARSSSVAKPGPVRSVSASAGRPSLTDTAGRHAPTSSTNQPPVKVMPSSARKSTLPVQLSAAKATMQVRVCVTVDDAWGELCGMFCCSPAKRTNCNAVAFDTI